MLQNALLLKLEGTTRYAGQHPTPAEGLGFFYAIVALFTQIFVFNVNLRIFPKNTNKYIYKIPRQIIIFRRFSNFFFPSFKKN